MEVLLDANFIISCILKKIDFKSQLEEKGFKIVVPREVIQELKDLKFRKGMSHEERTAINVALEIFSSKKIKKIGFGENKVDDMLIKKGKEGVYIATLDKEIKRQIPNKVIIIDAKKEIALERS